MQNIANIRTEYKQNELLESNAHADAIIQFEKWWTEAIKCEIEEVNAMTLCTVKNNTPDGRIVLLKGFTEKGFNFFSNYNSKKGVDITENNHASLVFFWKELQRQVRIVGIVEQLSNEESDAYYKSRPYGSQLGAWVSEQSKVIESRRVLDEKLKSLENIFTPETIIRPANWGGYIVQPTQIEFWQGRPSRLHDRLLYTKNNGAWTIERLAP